MGKENNAAISENQAKITEIKTELVRLGQIVGKPLSYDTLFHQLSEIFNRPQEERADALKQYFFATGKDWVAGFAETRTVISSAIPMAERNATHPSLRCSTLTVYNSAEAVLASVAKIIDPAYTHTKNFGATPKECFDQQNNAIHEHTLHAWAPKHLKQWDVACYNSAIRDFTNSIEARPDYRFSNNYDVRNGTASHTVALTYYRSTLVQNELNSHGTLWRIFNFRKFFAYRRFINGANETFRKIGFEPETHGEDALNFLRGALASPFEMDEDSIKDNYRNALEYERLKNIKELTVAREKMTKAIELDKDPATSLESKINPILQKYGVQMGEKIKNVIDDQTMMYYAEQYDKKRDINAVSTFSSKYFYLCFKEMLSTALRNNVEFRMEDLLRDAHNIAVIASKHYSVLYDHEEAKDAIISCAFGSMSIDSIKERMKFFNKNGNFCSEERMNQLVQEAQDAYQKLTADPNKLAEEDIALANSSYGVKQGEGEVEKEEKKEELIEEKQIEEKKEEKEEKIEVKEDKKEEFIENPKSVDPADKFFTIDFRPTMGDIATRVDEINRLVKYVNGNPSLHADAKKVFKANYAKIKEMKHYVGINGKDEHSLDAKWKEREDALKKEFPDYVPQSAEEVRQGMPEKMPISVDLKDDSHKIPVKEEEAVKNSPNLKKDL